MKAKITQRYKLIVNEHQGSIHGGECGLPRHLLTEFKILKKQTTNCIYFTC